MNEINVTDLLKLIDQQAKEIERLKEELKDTKRHLGEYISGLEYERDQEKAIAELAVKALKEINAKYMDYIENNIECDSAASTMDEIAENALEEIKRISAEGVSQ